MLYLLAVVTGWGAEFKDAAGPAGLGRFVNRQGTVRKDFIVESIGGGAGWIDYDGDGWMDAVLVGGEGAVCGLFRNNRDGTFTDVTVKAGLAAIRGWSMGVAVADYDGDGRDDFLLTGYGRNFLFRNRGDGRFEEVAERAGVASAGMWSTGAAFFDMDGDGDLDLYVARYVKHAQGRTPRSADCNFDGRRVFCGPRGMESDRHSLYRNDGDGAFREAPLPAVKGAHHGLGVIVLDYDDDGKPDVYVANDSTPNHLWRNLGAGSFVDVAVEAGVAFSGDGLEQASMGVDAGVLFGAARQDLFVTNFVNEPFALYRALGGGLFEDASFAAGIAKATLPAMGWSTHFVDLDEDGRLDIVAFNGHIYPEVGAANYRQRPLAFRNAGDGKFEAMPFFDTPLAARGAAVCDYDNDGDLDILVNNIDAAPTLLQRAGRPGNRWLQIAAPANAIGLRAAVGEQVREVRTQSGYLSSSDRRLHFSLGAAAVDVEIRWPDGRKQTVEAAPANRVLTLPRR